MAFSSLAFLLFFSCLFLLYWKVAKQRQWLLLLLASAYFYFSAVPAYGLLLSLVIGISYFTAISMEKQPQYKRIFLSLCLGFLFALLFVFKYFSFFSVSLVEVLAHFDLRISLPHFKFLLPLGLSFFTFQTAGYLIDVYRGKIKAEKNLGIYALFVSFFPLISSGPIERGDHLLPQLRKSQRFNYARTVSGLQLFTLGLFKKVVIADNLAVVVNHIFGSLPDYRGLSLLITIFLFSWQIYYDFSGYTDAARGIARVLGYDLLDNFHHPYFATSIGDFWRRWHISLSTWFRDYLYIPLGGNRKGLLRTCGNTLLVFVLCGLWHGASWNFVFWGLMHGLLLSFQRVFSFFMKQVPVVPSFFSLPMTYLLVCASWVFFRAETLADALYIFRNSLQGIRFFGSPAYVWATLSQMFTTNVWEMGIVAVCLICALAIEVFSWQKNSAQRFARLPLLLRWSIYSTGIFLLFFLRQAQITTFFYIQF